MTTRRRVAWCDTLILDDAANAAVRLDDLLTNAPPSDTLTVVRIIGDFTCSIPTLSETETGTAYDVGVGVINQEAFDLGSGVGIPNPTVEDSTPPRGWLYVSRQFVSQTVPSTGGVWRETAHYKFDLRGQRKIDKGVLYMWREHNSFVGTPQAIRVVGRIRVLFKT